MYLVGKKKDYQNKKCVTAPIVKPIYDQKPETFLFGLILTLLQPRNKYRISCCKLLTNLTPSLRRPCIHAIFFSTACRTACKHAFRFLRVFPEAVSTRHSWLPVTNVGWRVYTPVFRGVPGNTLRCPRAKGTAVSEWVHSFVDFCLIPLSTTCSVEVPVTNL